MANDINLRGLLLSRSKSVRTLFSSSGMLLPAGRAGTSTHTDIEVNTAAMNPSASK